MKLRRKLLVLGCLAAFVFAHLAPSNAAGISQSSKPSAKLQTLSWSWSDTQGRGDREFTEEEYWSVDELPVIELKVAPANPSRRVLLERFDESDQSWEIIAEERTNNRGEVVLFVAPDCQNVTGYDDSSWCDYTETLRMRVLKTLGQKQRISQTFDVTYVSSADDDSPDSDEDWDNAQN